MADAGTALTKTTSADWQVACSREPVIRALDEMPRITRVALRDAGAELGLSRSRLYELLARYREAPVTSSLLDQADGYPKGRQRLLPELEDVITAEIERFYLARPKPTLAQLVRSINHACLEQGLCAPTRKTIGRRVAAVGKKRLIKARDGAKAAADQFRPVIQYYEADYPLQIVQMDHTPADIIIVDEYFRRPLCRPALTLQIDIATRVIPGFYVSLEHPSATSVGMALRHGVLPKAQWLEERAVDMDYPVFGVPDVLHVDNAREFHSRALARGCQQHGINLRYRPKRTPHYGGHIERLIGTTIGEIHLLPGTTFSSVADKGDYDAEGQACMTLGEFERWLALQVGVYHCNKHSELGIPPIKAWQEMRGKRPLPLRLPVDPEQFLLDFLPFEMRKVRREGIELFHMFYWHGALTGLVADCDHKLPIKYNPLNLSAVYVELPDQTHLTVPLRDCRRPAITKFEHLAALKALRERGRQAVDEQALFDMVAEQRRIVLEAIEKTKIARKSAQRIAYALDIGSPPLVPTPAPAISAGDQREEPQDIVPFEIEERP
ncbi:Mu transposase C-terminal domain-containing protein [Novosphingobium huizhouense]|uniref:Mu transposase C-terminal domain-containing protein n=1 Tax=Novosphingobium huizhouense TaxID=2866625 RepID=UPI001CD81B67|nr:Mu transposase C-terminal domain-containing protein [Novosphingobium huizhouense]